MSTFLYVAQDPKGHIHTGSLKTFFRSQAQKKLLYQGYIPLVLHRQWFNKPLPFQIISEFSKELGLLLQAGIPVFEACTILMYNTHHAQLSIVLAQLRQALSEGHSLAGALSHNSQQFKSLFCQLIAAGESSGTLGSMLETLNTYHAYQMQLQKKLQKALLYPALLIIVTICVVSILLCTAIPQFEFLFSTFNAPLPRLTHIVILFSHGIQQWGLYILLSLLIGFLLIRYAHHHFEKFSYRTDIVLLRTPIIGNILHTHGTARFMRTLAITFAAGLPLVTALDVSLRVCSNRFFIYALQAGVPLLQAGMSLQHALSETQLFEPLVLEMVAIGEHTGKLEHMLTEIAERYETTFRQNLDTLGTLLEPILMIILGVGIGVLMVALYLPLLSIGQFT